MKYRQDAKLNSNKKTATATKGLQVQQIFFDKEITQQWKVDTNEPTEILPYALKRIYLTRLCDFWHQLKFFYHQNYHQFHQSQTKTKTVSLQVQEFESYSSVQVVHSAQVIENCKRISKVIWKIMRHRLIKGFNSIKERAGIEQDQSLELQDEKLRSYMIFLKLQQNSRIDLAIETCDSVVDKNVRRKLLEAFLGMKQHLKTSIKRQAYHDKIKLECFSEIIMRNIKKMNIDLFVDSFTEIFEFSQNLKREEYEQEEKRISLSEKKNDHYRSISNRKVVINDEDKSESMERRDTVIKNQQNGHKEITGKELRQNENHISTVKRENLLQKQILVKSNITSQYNWDIKLSHQNITHSHQYYEDQEEHFQNKNHNMNSLPTKRQYRSNNHHNHNKNTNNNNYTNKNTNNNYYTKKDTHDHQQHNQYLISGVQNNINSETLYHQKTIRTPSRSQIYKKNPSHQFQSINQSSKHSYNHQNQSFPHQDLHIPITQRTDQHYHQDHYHQQLLQQQLSHHNHESNSNIHQQICVIRNYSTTPTRKPDRYQKIPILSNNIEFRQFFLNSQQKKQHHKLTSHNSSFYQRKICSQCQYCSKLTQIKLMLQQISKQRHENQTHQIIKNVTMNNQIITDTFITNDDEVQSKQFIHQQPKYQSLESKTPHQTKKNYNSMQLNIDKINQSTNSRAQLIKIQKSSTNLKVQDQQKFIQKKYQRNHSPNSPLMTPIGQSLHTPLSQVSAFTEGAKTRGLSERKIFKRKPLHGK